MSTLSYKPLRESAHLVHLSDEEIQWKLEDKKRAENYFASFPKKEYARLYKRLLAPSKTRLISDANGKIEVILLTLPPYYDQKNPDIPVDPAHEHHLLRLLTHLSKHKRKYVIHCHASQTKTVKRWFRKLNIPSSSYTLSISVFNYSIWAQDAYVSLRNGSEKIILGESVCFTRDHDMSVADDLAIQANVKVIQSHLYFQGGNIIQAGDYAIVGKDYIMENLGRMFMETEKKVIKEFRRFFDRDLIVVGTGDIIPKNHRQSLGGGIFQPIFHVDMYISPTGLRNASGKELVFVGSPKLARQIMKEPSPDSDHDGYFDETARQLKQYFRVKRLPLLPTLFQSKEMETPRHYYLSYNNVLVENYGSEKNPSRHVFMPSYTASVKQFLNEPFITRYHGEESKYRLLDEAAEKIWEREGFTVYRIDGVEDLAMNWGSVHCITKALKRSETKVPAKKKIKK